VGNYAHRASRAGGVSSFCFRIGKLSRRLFGLERNAGRLMPASRLEVDCPFRKRSGLWSISLRAGRATSGSASRWRRCCSDHAASPPPPLQKVVQFHAERVHRVERRSPPRTAGRLAGIPAGSSCPAACQIAKLPAGADQPPLDPFAGEVVRSHAATVSRSAINGAGQHRGFDDG